MDNIQIQVDIDFKKKAEAILNSMGLDMEVAVKIFLTHVVNKRRIPFEIENESSVIELNDGQGSYICEFGHLHDYSLSNKYMIENPEEYEPAGEYNSFKDLVAEIKSELENEVDILKM